MNIQKWIIIVAIVALAILIPIAAYYRLPADTPPEPPLRAQAVEVVEPPSDVPHFMGDRALTNTVQIKWTSLTTTTQPVTHPITDGSVIALGFHTSLTDKDGNIIAQQTFILSPTITSTETIPTDTFMLVPYSYSADVMGNGILTDTVSAAWYLDGDTIRLNDVVRVVNTGRFVYLPIIME